MKHRAVVRGALATFAVVAATVACGTTAAPAEASTYVRDYYTEASCIQAGENSIPPWHDYYCVANGGGPEDPLSWSLFVD